MTDARQAAIDRIDRYAREAVARSRRQYDREGTLHAKAVEVFDDADIWEVPWVPDDFDLGRAVDHPVFQHGFTREQKLAWNHLQWGLDYARVAQGEMQLVALNRWAVRQYADVLPSVVDLEARESFEEQDHIDGFGLGLRALSQRHLPQDPDGLYAFAPSGFRSRRVNRVVRHLMGLAAERLLGSNFPTLFFLNRGLKTHGFKPFEHAIAQFEGGHPGMQRLSHLHRLDEARHMASAHVLSELSNAALDTVAREDWWLIEGSMRAAWPRGRQLASRGRYWTTLLRRSPTFASVPEEDREALLAHVLENLERNLTTAHERELKLTLPTNKRLLEASGLTPSGRRRVLAYLRSDPETARLVQTVELPEA